MIRRGRRIGRSTRSSRCTPRRAVPRSAAAACGATRARPTAARDALRLSRAMTFKAAAAGLPLGGGKGVICAEPGQAAHRSAPPRRAARLRRHRERPRRPLRDRGGRRHERRATWPRMAEGTDHVTGLATARGGSGDPSPFTARGSRRRCGRAASGASAARELEGRTVAVVGAGHVGTRLARRLAKAGAQLPACRYRPVAEASSADELGAKWTEPSSALRAEVDVLAPCALGGAIDQVDRPGGCGARSCAAPPTTSSPTTGWRRTSPRTGSSTRPDFIANAGGLINISVELGPGGYDADRARQRAADIEQTMGEVLDRAERDGVTPAGRRLRAGPRRRLADAGG